MKVQEGSVKILFKKFDKDFDIVYREVVKAEPLPEDDKSAEVTKEDQHKADLPDLSEEQLYELLEKMGYIERQLEHDTKLA